MIKPEVLVGMQPRQRGNVKSHVTPARNRCFRVGVGLCESEYRRSLVGRAPDSTGNQQISVNRNLNPAQSQFLLPLRSRRETEGRQLVRHSLDGMENINGVARIILAKRGNSRIFRPLIKHFFSLYKQIERPIPVRQIGAYYGANISVSSDGGNARVLGSSDDAHPCGVRRDHVKR